MYYLKPLLARFICVHAWLRPLPQPLPTPWGEEKEYIFASFAPPCGAKLAFFFAPDKAVISPPFRCFAAERGRVDGFCRRIKRILYFRCVWPEDFDWQKIPRGSLYICI